MRPLAEKAMALSLLMALSQALGFVLKATSLIPSDSWGNRLLKAATSLSSLAAKSLRLLVGEEIGVTIWTCLSGGNSGSCSGEVWVDQSDVGGLIFGHGMISTSAHLESSFRGSLNLGGKCRHRPH